MTVTESAVVTSVNLYMANSSWSHSYIGTGTYLYLWGAQTETDAAFPTPYVKTTTGTVDATGDVPTMSDVSWKRMRHKEHF
jgi:hypothetical protein